MNFDRAAIEPKAQARRLTSHAARLISRRGQGDELCFPGTASPKEPLFWYQEPQRPAASMFARGAVRSSRPNGFDATCFTLDGHFSEIAPLWAALARVDALIVNLPMVAWKRTFLAPALALFLARLQAYAQS